MLLFRYQAISGSQVSCCPWLIQVGLRVRRKWRATQQHVIAIAVDNNYYFYIIADASVCDLPVKSGFCTRYFPRYYYDSKVGKCLKFIYGGCGGNKNNFETEEECKRTCGKFSL